MCLAGEGTGFDSSGYFGDDGVIEASGTIAGLGEVVSGPVYVATPARAVADMLLSRLLQRRRSLAHLNLDSWLSEREKTVLIRLLAKAFDRFGDEDIDILEHLLGRKLNSGGVGEAA